MRWLSLGIIKNIDCDIYYNYNTDEHKFGTGFHVFKKTKPDAIGFWQSNRIYTIRVLENCVCITNSINHLLFINSTNVQGFVFKTY